ncbi:MAG: hypothetical protein KME64_13985 [Scytonematopsis contorta HA4267-MV1]|jgi:hypothetical protein|nr:hypothetical protein [Scytonematopsis contorta HA4267-MV1]
MTHKSLKGKDNSEHLRVANQLDFHSDLSVNHALTAVAQEVAELIKQMILKQSS